MLVLTLNLHTYQEKNQEQKFDEIVKAIFFYSPDFICFQECAQHKNSVLINNSKNIRIDNMAEIICRKLKCYNLNYLYFWDWAHYGWNVWEEGIAILSKFKFKLTDSIYVSKSESVHDTFGSRRALYACVNHPEFGNINIFCVHLSWESAGLLYQIETLNSFINKNTENNLYSSIICGDFNDEPKGKGYKRFIELSYIDSYSEANPDKQNTVTNPPDKRIDYIFFKSSSKQILKIESSIILFDDKNFKKVSDHYGVLTHFQPIFL